MSSSPKLSSMMSGATEKPGSMRTLDLLKKSQDAPADDPLVGIVKDVIHKLQNNPTSITTEDARRLSENTVVSDLQTAKIISAVEAIASSSAIIHQVDPTLGQAPRTSLPTIITDLKAAVDQNPNDVTTEVLKNAQNVVSKMQKAVGHTNAPHPELEAQLREEIAKIELKVAEGTVTIEEANHLHSLEARAHGHTEKGGITSIAQSVAAKRERQLSLSSGSGSSGIRSSANSKTFIPQDQSHLDKESNPKNAEDAIKPGIEQGTASEDDVKLLHSCETRAHGHTEKGGLASSAQSVAAKKRQDSLSDQTNLTPEARKNLTKHEHEISQKLADMSVGSQAKV
ncbi:hypothetical protein HBH98_205930 [Parastagonospora nodorum]|nr:hypothetical protein HBH53_197630 [Parastagonospora nodorum]KAH3966697.1 hypothetical protein HBH52_194540 [Parastagonospora nodorum]KAH4076192.1 hypothetical protein HBH50_001790 [Parastagonospora nodorum]KAH4081779.1 hypothetical protein HBH48_193240 [Parastagonospora nodorum]KAH4092671.1 hypothetical protein HBH46_180880 [Parastagonospora nodorum]